MGYDFPTTTYFFQVEIPGDDDTFLNYDYGSVPMGTSLNRHQFHEMLRAMSHISKIIDKAAWMVALDLPF